MNNPYVFTIHLDFETSPNEACFDLGWFVVNEYHLSMVTLHAIM